MDQILPMTDAARELDREVQAGRAMRPAAVSELRTKPRMSIAELNGTDMEEVRSRLQSYVGDTRGPVTRFLDMIDVPRNAVVGAVAPGLRKRMESEGNTGTFGRGRVMFSDVLGELGMEPGLARGVLGFVGDVALDPLTWLGPAGWGAKVSSGAKSLELGASGRRAIEGAANALRKGGEISDPVLRKFYHAHADEAIHAADGASKAKFFTEKAFGAPVSESKLGTASRYAFGGDAHFQGSRIAEDFDKLGNISKMPLDEVAKVDEEMANLIARNNMGEPVGHVVAKRMEDLAKRDAQVEAAKDVVARYGRGGSYGTGARMGPQGALFGNAGSQIAHVPFTDYGVYVPAFSSNAAAAVAARAQAMAKTGSPLAAAHVVRAYDVVSKFPEITRELENAQGELAALRERQANPRLSMVWGYDDTGKPVRLLENVDKQVEAANEKVRSIVDGYRSQQLSLLKDWDELKKSGGLDNLNIGDIQAARAMMDVAGSQFNHAESALRASPWWEQFHNRLSATGPNANRKDALLEGPFIGARDKILKDVAATADTTPEVAGLNNSVEAMRAIVDEHALRYDQRISQLRRRGPRYHDAAAALEDEKAQFLNDFAVEHIVPLAKKRDELKASVVDGLIRDKLKPHQQAIVAQADEDIERATQMADVTAAYARSLLDLHGRTGGVITDSISARPFEILSNVAKWHLGLTDSVLGASLFAPMEAAAMSAFDKYKGGAFADASATGRVTFGNRSAAVNEPAARMVRLMNGGGFDQAEAAIEPLFLKFRDLAKEHGISEGELDSVMSLWLAKVYQRHPGGFNEKFWPTLANGEPEPTLQLLSEAANGGFLDQKIHGGKYKGLGEKLDALADETAQMLKELGDVGVEEQALQRGQILGGYVPHTMDPAFARLAHGNKLEGGPNKSARTISEGFQKPRYTYKYQFTDSTGNVREFTEMDRHWMAENAETLATLEQEYPEITNLRETIAEFNKLTEGVSDEMKPQLFGRPMTIFELNKRKKAGYFNYMSGMDDKLERVFSENMLHILPQRINAHFRATARRQWREAYQPTALNINEKVANTQNMDTGMAITFANGAKGIVDGKENVVVGNVRYRPLAEAVRKSALNEDSLLNGLFQHEDMLRYYPEQVAEQIERIAAFSSGDQVQPILRAVESMNKLWKGYTLLHPNWITFNVAGNIWNLATNRLPMDSFTRLMPDWIKAAWMSKHPEEMAKRTMSVRGQPVSYAELWKDAERVGAVNNNLSLGYAQDMFADAKVRPNETLLGGTFKEKMARHFRQFTEAYERQLKFDQMSKKISNTPSRWQKFKVAREVLKDEKYVGRMFAQWNAVNSMAENSMRFGAYVSYLDKGYSPIQAAAEVRKSLFDYTDMTKAEEQLRRVWMPFYAWMRNNGAFQMKMLLENPKWAAMAPKLKEMIEESLAGEEAVPDWARPGWMRDEMAVQLGKDPELRKALTLGSVVPSEPVGKIGQAMTGVQGAMGALKYFTSMVNPWVQGAISLAQGRDVYSGREIGAGPGEGDVTASEYVLGQLRPIRELIPLGARKSPMGRAIEEGPGAVAGRLLLGGRLQPFGQDKVQFQRSREFKDKESKLRKYIAVAEREDNKKESLRGRVMLMDHYRTGMRQGLEKDVPVWARKQLVSAQENRK